jgi:hypothetical protein
MGYDLHITRKEFHADSDGPEITADEWMAYIASDPELRLAPECGKHHAMLRIQSKYPEPWLDWFGGCVYTKNPDKAIVAKMIQIAERLNARVQGDDGEFYEDTSEVPD